MSQLPSPPPATTGRRPRCRRCSRCRSSTCCSRRSSVHRAHHEPNTVQMSTLLSIKTGACPEDCAYCPQSVRYDTGVAAEALMQVDGGARARAARQGRRRHALLHGRGLALAQGARPEGDRADGRARCARSGWRAAPPSACSSPRRRRSSRPPASTTTTTTSTPPRSSTAQIITTRTYQDRLDTLAAVREAGLKVCCGGIIGMGESARDRAQLLRTLANLPQHPESVPINQLVQVPARRWPTPPPSTRSISCAPSPWRASSCRARTCACPRAARR